MEIEGNLVHALPLLVIILIISIPKEKQMKLLTNMVWKQYYLNIQLIAMKKTTNRGGDVMGLTGLLIDKTPYLVA